MRQLSEQITAIDRHLDAEAGLLYTEQPLAQDWARISKVAEELGEAVSAFIGVTGQNPRKGFYSSYNEVVKELLDVAATAILAVEHFTKDESALNHLSNHIHYLHKRIFDGQSD